MRIAPLAELGRCTVLLWVLALAAPAARAVVISSSFQTPVLKAPADDPGWNNVGEIGGGSGVYLGNRWVITADHVGGTQFSTSDGRKFTASVGSSAHLSNGNLSIFGTPDLRIFRLSADPGLPALSIMSSSPTVGTQVTMIGSGIDRAETLRGWQLTGSTSGDVQWNETSPLNASVTGFSLLNSGPMRWGQNTVARGSDFRSSDATFVFSTTFDQQGLTFEAQATPGDSGGGVFVKTDAGWQLAGLMITNQPLVNQPANTVTFGEGTAIADLTVYRDQILSALNRPEPLWQNQVNYYDVNGNGGVTTGDLMVMVNDLLKSGNRDLNGPHNGTTDWLDVTGDLRVDRSDLMALVNQLLRQRSGVASPAASPFAASLEDLHTIPEPGSLLLAAIAGLSGLLARRKLRVRKPRRSRQAQ